MVKWGRRRRWPMSRHRSSKPIFSHPKSKSFKLHISWKVRWSLGLLILFMLVYLIFSSLDHRIKEPLLHIASIRVKQVASEAINKAVTERVANNSSTDHFVQWKTNAQGKITGFELNYDSQAQLRAEITQAIQQQLQKTGHIPDYVPLGQLWGSTLLASVGPRIPVEFEPLGTVKVDLLTRQKEAGINMVLVEVYMKVVTEVAITVPFDRKPETVQTEIPISYMLVVGDVPTYYYDGNGQPVGQTAPQAPSLSIPNVK